MATEGKPKKRFIVSIVGLLLVILGVLWITVIFPAIDKVPLDYDREYHFVGNFTVREPDPPYNLVFFPVTQELVQKANGTKDGALLIHEVRTVINTETGDDISAIYGDESTLAINRSTLEFAKVDERERWGQWGPPRPVAKEGYDLWNPGAGKALPANYIRSEDFRGLDVLVFEINAVDLSVIKQGVPVSYSTRITMWIEPSSGTVVDQDSETIIEADVPGKGKQVVDKSLVRYAEETIVDLMDIAKSAHTMLLWFRTIIPWILIGLGAVMVLIDVLVLPRIQARRE